MELIKGWKTVLFNIIAAVIGVLEVTDFTDLISPNYQGVLLALVGFVNILLRAYTNTPIGRKE